MRIGLYSELAREHIVKIRQEISDAKVDFNIKALKNFREKIITSKQDHHKVICSSTDFYSLSTLRDLLFHALERRFTIPKIRGCLEELGLMFSRFEAEHIIEDFRLKNVCAGDPYDLEKWQSYEEANPRSFAGLYQFWCQKV